MAARLLGTVSKSYVLKSRFQDASFRAPSFRHHLDLRDLAVRVELVVQVLLGDVRREAAHPQRRHALVLGRLRQAVGHLGVKQT